MNTRLRYAALAVTLLAAAALPFTSADARGSHHKHATSSKSTSSGGGAGYINSKGEWVPSPTKSVNGKVPAGASAQCADGTYSFSHSRRGTCSHHGGVATWQPSSPPP